MLKVGIDLRVFIYLYVYRFYIVRACCFDNQREKNIKQTLHIIISSFIFRARLELLFLDIFRYSQTFLEWILQLNIKFVKFVSSLEYDVLVIKQVILREWGVVFRDFSYTFFSRSSRKFIWEYFLLKGMMLSSHCNLDIGSLQISTDIKETAYGILLLQVIIFICYFKYL